MFQTLARGANLDTGMVEQEWIGLKAVVIADDELRTRNNYEQLDHADNDKEGPEDV